MRTIKITVVGPEGRGDVSALSEVPVADLMGTLVGVVARAEDADGWELRRPGGRGTLVPERSLADQDIEDGGVLQLRRTGASVGDEPKPAPDPPEPAPAPPAPAPAPTPSAEPRQQRPPPADEPGSPIERTRDTLPDQAGFGERYSSALRALVSSESPLSHQRTDSGAPGVPAPADLTTQARSTALERMRYAWRETDYRRRLDNRIVAPRLSRCVTIAVVSPKGGVGKTTITALLGTLFAHLRRDRTVAIDTNPDYGSLGRTLVPGHRVFVDDVIGLLEDPQLSTTQLDASLGRATNGLMVLPAPTDPSRMAQLDEDAYARLIERLQTLAGLLVLDCGTGLQEPAARAAVAAADELVLVSDPEPSTASLVAEANAGLESAGAPIVLVVNKLPPRRARLDLEALARELPRARGLITLRNDPRAATIVNAGEFAWGDDSRSPWSRGVRELAALLVHEWPRLDLTV